MKRLGFAAALVTLLVASFAALAAGAVGAGSVSVTEATSSQFPVKLYSLSLPKKTRLTAGKLTVLENGRPVHDLQLLTPGAAGGNFGVLLLIDASNSMTGKPIAGAMAAARTFAERRNPGQQLAVMTFNNSSHVLLPFTNDAKLISDALTKTPKLAEGTHIYDALEAAEQEIRDSTISVASIVLLSDGKDVGSSTKSSKALSDAKDAKARVYTVGLKSRQFDANALSSIANATGATFSVASNASDLAKIYSALGYSLSNEYLIRYKSLAGPDKKVTLTVRVKGFPGTARTSYVTPSLPTGHTIPVSRSRWDRIIQSTTTAALVVAAFVVLIGMGVFLALRQRDRRFEQRLSQFVSLPLEERAKLRREDVAAALAAGSRRFSFTNFSWYKRLEEDVELARIEMRPSTIVGLTIVLGVVIGIVFSVILGTPWALLIGLVAPVFPRAIVARKLKSVRRDFEEQLADNLDVLGSALRTGHSFVGALSVAVEDAGEPSQSEFRRAIADEQLGVPIEEALRVISIRMANRDLIQVALVARLQREAGTNAAEVLDQVATNIRNRMEIKRLIRTLTAQGRMARWIVSFLPFFLFGAIYLLNRHYLSPLWTHGVGIVAMAVAFCMICAGSYVIKRIIEIEV